MVFLLPVGLVSVLALFASSFSNSGTHVVGVDPVRRAAVALDPAAEADGVEHLGTGELPGIAADQPGLVLEACRGLWDFVAGQNDFIQDTGNIIKTQQAF